MIKQKVLAIIPARGGSKGAPRKNIKPLLKKPLIYYSIKSALESKLIDKVVVSSDDDKILQIAKKNGSETIKRPARLATDTASTEGALEHVLDEYP